MDVMAKTAKKKAGAKKSAVKKSPAKKKTAKKKTAAKKAAKKAAAKSASDVYSGQVADIIAGQDTRTAWRPESAPKLSLVRLRTPKDPRELSPGERAQLEAIWHGEPLANVLASPENHVELADLVDEHGKLAYRLLAWNYGVCYVLVGETTEIAAMGTQHDMEAWDEDSQRALFYAIDRALASAKKSDKPYQPLSFGWWEDDEWAETHERSHPYQRLRIEAGRFVPVK
jgi:hypothetical protein